MKKPDKDKCSVAVKKVKTAQQIIIKTSIGTVTPRPSPIFNRPRVFSTCKTCNNNYYFIHLLFLAMEKVKIPGQMSGPRRVGLSRSAPTRPLSPVKLKKFD